MVSSFCSARGQTLGFYAGYASCFGLSWFPRNGHLRLGWITVFAWICNVTSSLSLLSNCVSGLIIFNVPIYEPQWWHPTLLLIAFVTPVLLNFDLRKVLNYLENIRAVFHIIFLIATIAIHNLMPYRSAPGFVFNTLTTGSGWENPGVAWPIGLLTTAFPVSSSDGILHRSMSAGGANICDKISILT